MLKIFAVDTSMSVASGAILNDENVISEFIVNDKKTHSQKLMPMISMLFEISDLSPEQMDFFAVSIGPGSFTGLRIGITTIKAMAYSLDKRIICVPTLDAMVYNIPRNDGIICPMIDARNEQVYSALYKYNDSVPERLTEYQAIHLKDIVRIINEFDVEVTIIYERYINYKDFFETNIKKRVNFISNYMNFQKASSVAIAALKTYNRDANIFAPKDVKPLYVRKSQAERLHGTL